MRRGWLRLALCGAVLAFPARALAQGLPDAAACDRAAAAAGAAYGLPPGLLAAVGRVESGRRDPMSGRIAPWPWAVDVDGAGAFPPDRDAAVAMVRAAQARGVRNIDVGCFQVNLLHHPDAFATLADAFDPDANARYAARFLAALRQRTGTWPAAVMAYHSASPDLGPAYRDRVLAAWAGRDGPPLLHLAAMGAGDSSVHVWTPVPSGRARAVVVIAPGGGVLPKVVSP